MVECGRYAHLDTSNDRPDRCPQTSIRAVSRSPPALPGDRAGKRAPRAACVEHPLSIGQGRRSHRPTNGPTPGNHGSCRIDRASASGAPTGNRRIRTLDRVEDPRRLDEGDRSLRVGGGPCHRTGCIDRRRSWWFRMAWTQIDFGRPTTDGTIRSPLWDVLSATRDPRTPWKPLRSSVGTIGSWSSSAMDQ